MGGFVANVSQTKMSPDFVMQVLFACWGTLILAGFLAGVFVANVSQTKMGPDFVMQV